ncbi:MAG: alpha-amylase family glycosyl hydrolase [Prevotella sp.]|nr:alpha-amylase family glycosyl hydrolase [Prevotella sp.]
MKKIFRRLNVLFALMLFWQGATFAQMETIQQGTILHCFDWKYTDIQASLQSIKDAGFTAVQTSPAQKNYTGDTEWSTLYRPRNPSEIGPNTLGTKDQLQALCTAAHAVGIKVIVDVVANHADGVNYVDNEWKSSEYYHGNGNVSNWNDRTQVINNDVSGLRDINTNNSTVQSRMKAFIQNLKAIGVDGIRWDAAKHIGLPSEGDSFWENVLDKTMFNYGEILNNTGGNDATLIPEYLSYMSITDSPYGTNNVLGSAKNGQATPYGGGNYSFTYKTNKLVYWGESHDTYCNNDGASVGVSQEVVDRAYAVAASHNEIPALYLSRPTVAGTSARAGVKGSTHFTSKSVAEVNLFHNAMDGKADYYTGNGSAASITRKDGGAIVVNFAGAGNVSIANGGGYATPGTYTDRVSGNTWTITSTTISGTTDATGIAILYGTPSNDAGIAVSPDGGSFTTETEDVTLTPNANTTSYWYQINDGKKTTVSTQTASTVTIGAGLDYGSTITLSWGASNSEGKEKTGTATFTKRDPSAAISVYVQSSTAPYIYVWYTDANNKVVEPNGSWATMKEMSSYTSGWYVYTAPEGVSSINFILTTKAGASDADKLTANIKDVTSDVYYRVSDGTAAVTDNRPGNDNSFEPELESADENCVFLESSTKSYIYAFSAANTAIVGAWPGAQMTKVGETSAGVPVYKYTFSANQMADMPSETESTSKAGIIFNDGNGNQTGNLSFHNRGYYVDGAFTRTITKVKDPTGINGVSKSEAVDSNVWYTVSGVRISKPTKHGIYIHNGKKYVY